ncbi:MAG: DUF6868 family protein [Verrucomicrobiota bacterium]
MDMVLLKEFFGWMVLINFGIFMISAIMCITLKGFVQRVHGKMFGLAPETINAFLYGYLGAYKIAFTAFMLAPWIALTIMC